MDESARPHLHRRAGRRRQGRQLGLRARPAERLDAPRLEPQLAAARATSSRSTASCRRIRSTSRTRARCSCPTAGKCSRARRSTSTPPPRHRPRNRRREADGNDGGRDSSNDGAASVVRRSRRSRGRDRRRGVLAHVLRPVGRGHRRQDSDHSLPRRRLRGLARDLCDARRCSPRQAASLRT